MTHYDFKKHKAKNTKSKHLPVGRQETQSKKPETKKSVFWIIKKNK